MYTILSRRVARLMMTDALSEFSVREREDFVIKVSKFRAFEDLPIELQTLFKTIEKNERI